LKKKRTTAAATFAVLVAGEAVLTAARLTGKK
jgi:hypothetical protein